MSKLNFSLNPETGTLSENDAKRYFSIVGLASGTLVLVYYVASLALTLLLYYLAPHWAEHALVQQAMSLIPLYGIAFPCFYLILRRLPCEAASSGKLGVKGFLMTFCVSIAFMMAGNSIGNTLIILFELVSGRVLLNPVAEMTVGQSWWINLIFVGILAPILEELVFRKVLCKRLLPLGEGYAIVLSAAVFGLAHGNFFQFFYAFALGLLFAFVYVKTGRIRYSIVYHSMINILGGVFAPWVTERIAPIMEEEFLTQMNALAQASDYVAWYELVSPYLVPVTLLAVYDILLFVAGVCGLIFLYKERKKLQFQKGLLPPPKEGRVANVFCNVGVAVALTVFTVIFVLSLIA